MNLKHAAFALVATFLALVAIPAEASAGCGWTRNYHGQRIWVPCNQQPAAHYYRRDPPRAYRHKPVVVAAPVYAPVQGQICPQTGQVLPQTAIRQQSGWQPTVDCDKVGGKRVINPNTGNPSCLVP